jgi:hypothetical protein
MHKHEWKIAQEKNKLGCKSRQNERSILFNIQKRQKHTYFAVYILLIHHDFIELTFKTFENVSIQFRLMLS